MAKNTKENFDYTGYAKSVMGLNDDELQELEMNQAQRDHIYQQAVKDVHELNIKDVGGRSKEKRLNATMRTMEQFEGAREILGVPEEVEDFQEPYKPETFKNFLTTIHPGNREMSVNTFLDNYASQFYDGEYAELERPALKQLSKSEFKTRVKNELEEQINFDEPVSTALEQLETFLNQPVETVQEDGGEGNIVNEDGQLVNKDSAVKQGARTAVDFVKSLGVGAYNSVVDTVSGGLQVTDALLSESKYANVVYDRETQEFKEVGLFNDEVIEDDSRFLEKSNLVKLSDLISENLKVNQQPENFTEKLGMASGQILGMLVGGGVAGKVAGKVAGTTTATTMGINQGAASGYQDYINTITETGQVFDPYTAREVVGFNALIGASESAPPLKALSRLTPDGKTPIGTFLKKIDDVSNNSVSRAINKVAQSNAGKRVGRVAQSRGANITTSGLIGGVEEAGQELFAGIASNLVASDIVGYDPERGFVTSDDIEGSQIGGIIGTFLNTVMAAMPVKGRKRVHNQFADEDNQVPTDDATTTQPGQDGTTTSETPESDAEPTETAQDTATTETPQTEPVIREADGTILADMNGVVGIGKTEAEAIANMRKQLGDGVILADIKEDFELETENLEEGGQRAILRAENGDVTFIGENAESELTDLIESYDPQDPNTVLPSDLEIEKNESGYTFTRGSTKVESENLQDGLAELNQSIRKERMGENLLEVLPERIPEPVIIPIGENGFDYTETQEALEANGYVPLTLKRKSVSDPVTEVRAYKNGFIYTIDTKKSGTNSSKAIIKIEDLDGNKYKPNQNEVTQEYLVSNVLQEPINGNVKEREVNISPGSVQQGGVVLRQPSKGIITRRSPIAGEDMTVIDAESVDNVAQRVGGEVLFSDSYNAVIKVNDISTTFRLDDDGNLNVFVGDQGKLFDGPFIVNNTGNRNQLSMSTMVKELETLNYRVVDVTNKTVKVQNPQGNVEVLKRGFKKQFEIETDDGNFKINNMNDFKILHNMSPSVDPKELASNEDILASIEATRETNTENVEPDNTQISRQKEQALKNMFDFTEEFNKVQNIGGRPTFVSNPVVNESGENRYIPPNVVFNIEYSKDNIESTLENLRFSDAHITQYEINAEYGSDINIDWEKADVENYMKLLPEHIKDLINLYTDNVNPVSSIQTNNGKIRGIFTVSDVNNRPSIGIDIHKGRPRSLNAVLSTISHEVSHFSFDSWGLRDLDVLYDKLYSLVKTEAVRNLKPYIVEHNIDVNNPEPKHKWLMVNEFFADQGTTFLDFQPDKLEPPPGFTRKDIQELKKSVVGTIQNITLDLTNDKNRNFTGDKESGRKFIENILRLQAGVTVGRGVKLTYKVNRTDGTPAHIEVNTTPYGSSVTTTNQTRNAKKIGAMKKKLANLTGFSKTLYRFWQDYGFQAIYETPLGRNITLELTSLVKPGSSAKAKQLKLINHRMLKVRAWLDSIGVGNVPIEDSYEKTFRKHGLTTDRQLKYAQEADMFMKQAHIMVNDGAGALRATVRRSKDIMYDIVQNHPGAKKNLPTWFRIFDANADRLSSNYTHRAYEVFQPGGDVALTKMKKAMDVSDDPNKTTLHEDAQKAELKIKQLKSDIKSGKIKPHKGYVKIREQKEIIRIKDRLESLRKWATSIRGSEGPVAIRGQMREMIRNLLEDRTHVISEFSMDVTGRNVPGLKGRKLDENTERDRWLMDFYGEIDDPLLVAVSSIEQQNKAMNNIQRTTAIATILEQNGIARPIGSTVEQSEYIHGDQVFPPENAGMLAFFEIHPDFSEWIQQDLNMGMNVYQNSMGNWVRAFRFIKQGMTVLSPKLIASNFTSNLGNLVYGGHLMYLNRLNKTVKGIRQAWANNVEFGKHIRQETFAEMIIRETEEHNIIQSGTSSLDAQVSNSGVIEKLVSSAVGTLSKQGIISDSKRLTTVELTNRTMNLMKELYAFGDGYAKILPYIINREMTIQKARLVTDRANFPDGEEGNLLYEQAVIDKAVSEAADRTIRETVTWAVSHGIARAVTRNGFSVIFNNFMMHPAQMLKVIAENSRLLTEDAVETNWAIKNGHTDYAKTVGMRVGTRAAGNVTSYFSAYSIWAGQMGIYGWLAFTLAQSLVSDDEEDTPIKDRKALTDLEAQAAMDINNFKQSSWGGNPMYPILRDGWKVTYYDGNRLAALNAVFSVKPFTTQEGGVFDYFKELSKSFIDPSKENIEVRLFNLFATGRDRWGKKQTLTERVKEFFNLFNPGAIRQGTTFGKALQDVVFKPPVSEMEPQQTTALRDAVFTLLGVKVMDEDMRDTPVYLGYLISNQTNRGQNETLDYVRNRFESGDELGSEVASLVQELYDNNEEVYGKAEAAVNAYYNFGFKYNDLKKWVKTNVSGDRKINPPKDVTESILKGENGFHKKIIKQLNSKLSDIKDYNVSNELSRESIDNQIEAHEKAIKLYERHLDKKQ